MVLHAGTLPPEPAYPNHMDWSVLDFALYTGESRQPLGFKLTRQISPTELSAIQAGNLPLFLYGRIDYKSMGNDLFTGFCRVFDPGTGEWKRTHAPKYNEET